MRMENILTDAVADIRAQASDWIVRLSGDDTAELRAACDTWRAQDPLHDHVFRQVEQLWQAMTPDGAKKRRRHIATAAMFALCAGLAWQYLPLNYWMADQRTVVGEVRRVELQDGSVLTLNSHSAVNIQFNDRERVIRLVSGEVEAKVAEDAAGRPFVVEDRDGRAVALGTLYTVRQDTDNTTVTVIESKVAVSSRAHPETPTVVHAGEQVRLTIQGVESVEAAPLGADSWVTGRLVFQDVPLSAVIAELARYQAGILRVQENAAALRFTGVLPADDPGAALDILTQALPLQPHHLTPYLIWVDMKAKQPQP